MMEELHYHHDNPESLQKHYPVATTQNVLPMTVLPAPKKVVLQPSNTSSVTIEYGTSMKVVISSLPAQTIYMATDQVFYEKMVI